MKKILSLVLANAMIMGAMLQPVSAQAGLLRDIKDAVLGTIEAGTELVLDGGKVVVKGTKKVAKLGSRIIIDGVDVVIEIVDEPVKFVSQGIKHTVVGSFKTGKFLVKKAFKGTVKITRGTLKAVFETIDFAHDHALKPAAVVVYKGTVFLITTPIEVVGGVFDEIRELPIFHTDSEKELRQIMSETAGDDASLVEVR